jgi:asparagine synthase (glutamine-hydrolysing)
MISERPLGCLLSGGLDSSLVSGIAAKILKEQGKRLTTFSIGMTDDSPDIINARLVAKHINSIHHEIIIPPEKWIEELKNVIRQIETYDITTIRASTAQYLLAKWISENTNKGYFKW